MSLSDSTTHLLRGLQGCQLGEYSALPPTLLPHAHSLTSTLAGRHVRSLSAHPPFPHPTHPADPLCTSRGQPLWRGRIRVIEKGSDVPSKCFIRLEDANSGELFGICPYQPSKANTNGGVEAVLDSSRYFVLTLVDQESGQKAYLGMGYPERSEAFDFNVALQVSHSRITSSTKLY